jgi:GAF domain-containing protein
MNIFIRLTVKISNILHSNADNKTKLKSVCDILKTDVKHYDWVGFYIMDKNGENLILSVFNGEPTAHTKIPVGKGICGQAAATKKTFVVQDVSQESNYLSCSSKVKSEIVIPIFKDGKVVGELDIDSHRVYPFTPEDRKFLENICKKVSEIL